MKKLAIVFAFALIAAAPTWTGPARSTASQLASSSDPVIMAAGDIASPGSPSQAQIDTAALIVHEDPSAVLALGDDQYKDGLLRDFNKSYDPTWGRFRPKTYPVPGNHEWNTLDHGYFAYFGKRANPPRGYYSFNLGAWHLIALNSRDGSAPQSSQVNWLRNDLASDHHLCELAFFHHPRYSSGKKHGSTAAMQPFWSAFSSAGGDVILNGHEHSYERFTKIDGIRQFVVGTGGLAEYGFGTPLPTSGKRISGVSGALQLFLHQDSYTWKFLDTNGRALDTGTTACHP